LEFYKETLLTIKSHGLTGRSFKELLTETSLDTNTLYSLLGRMKRLGAITSYRNEDDVWVFRAKLAQEQLYKPGFNKGYKNSRSRRVARLNRIEH
jgi:hypothetical protein